MPTSPRRKIHRINNAFRQNRNILHRADVGISPYDILLSQSQAAHGGFLLSKNLCHCEAGFSAEFGIVPDKIFPGLVCDGDTGI